MCGAVCGVFICGCSIFLLLNITVCISIRSATFQPGGTMKPPLLSRGSSGSVGSTRKLNIAGAEAFEREMVDEQHRKLERMQRNMQSRDTVYVFRSLGVGIVGVIVIFLLILGYLGKRKKRE